MLLWMLRVGLLWRFDLSFYKDRAKTFMTNESTLVFVWPAEICIFQSVNFKGEENAMN